MDDEISTDVNHQDIFLQILYFYVPYGFQEYPLILALQIASFIPKYMEDMHYKQKRVHKNMWASYHYFSTETKLMKMWSAMIETFLKGPYFSQYLINLLREVMEETMLIVFPKVEPRDGDSSPTIYMTVSA